jgi:environmental stress-induced protein Ves
MDHPPAAFNIQRIAAGQSGRGLPQNHHGPGRAIDHRLDQPCVPFAFSGDNELDCTLLGGTSTDFNVMTRRGQLRAEVVVLRESATLPLSQRGLLWVLRGTWALGGTSTCTAGQGLWWDGRALGGPVVPNEGDSVLVWVHLIEEA